MTDNLARTGNLFSGLSVVEEKMDGMREAASKLISYMTPADSNESQVNHRPAAQQWTVCTP